MSRPAWIGLGSNLGDRQAILDAAVAALAEQPGIVVEAVSAYHQTQPVGGPPGQGPFLNAAARLRTTLAPCELLGVAHEIEASLGRVRAARWGERTLDVDLLIHGDATLDTPDLKIPHPRLPFRRFVLAPMAEIDPTVVDPSTGRTIADLLANLDREPRCLAVEGTRDHRKSTILRRLAEELSRPEVAPRPPWIITDDLPTPDSSQPSRPQEGPVPTFIVIFPEGRDPRRTPVPSKVPRLRPDSDEPDAIVDEILATCRSIEGG